MKIPYVNIGVQHAHNKKEILNKIESLLDSGMFILGKEVADFETTFAQLCGTKYAVGVSNGTDALVLAIKALGIGKGDEVITAPNSFLASASSIYLAGATPVFADVDYQSMNIDVREIEKKITPNTKAIMPVHLTGQPADMDAILALAKKHNIAVIEDAAQAVGAKYKGKVVGSIGNFGCFSLHPLKNLAAAGDAGMITTNNKEHYEWLLKARNHGLKSRDECEFWSSNSRLDAVQAAVLNVKIKSLNTWNNRRKEIADYYIKELKNSVDCPEYTNDYSPVFHAFMIKTEKQQELIPFLQKKGIDTKTHYPIAIHQQEAWKGSTGKLPITEKLIKQIVSLPVYPELTNEQTHYIVSCIKEFYSAK